MNFFERHVEITPAIKYCGNPYRASNLQSVNFFIDETVGKPPEFMDVYLTDGDALIYIREYACKDVKLNVIYQTRFLRQTYYGIFTGRRLPFLGESRNILSSPLPGVLFQAFTRKLKRVDGATFLAIFGLKCLLYNSDSGKTIFLNPAEQATRRRADRNHGI